MITNIILYLTVALLAQIPSTPAGSLKILYRFDFVSIAALSRLNTSGAQPIVIIDGSLDSSKKDFVNASVAAVVTAVHQKLGDSLPPMGLIDLPWSTPQRKKTISDATARMVSLVNALKASYPDTKWAWRGVPSITMTSGPSAASTSDSRKIAAVQRWQELGRAVDWMNPDSTVQGAIPDETSGFAEWMLTTKSVCNEIANGKEIIPAVTQWRRTAPTKKKRQPVFTILPMQTVLGQTTLLRDRNFGAVLFAAPKDLPSSTAIACSTSMSSTVEAIRLRESMANTSPATPPAPPATPPALPATPPALPAVTVPFAQQVTDTNSSAAQALTQIPQRLLVESSVSMSFVPTDWGAIFDRALNSPALQGMIPQLLRMAEIASTAAPNRYVRPNTFEAIPPDMLYQGTLAIQPTLRRDLNQLANVDTIQTSFIRTQGVALAIVAHRTRNAIYIAKCLEMLEALNTYVPMQRPGSTYGDETVPMRPDGDGVWLATAWGMDAIIEMVSALGDDIPAELRGRLEVQLRNEVARIAKDWADKRPWFVKSRKSMSNQWIEPNVALIKACLFLKDQRLLPAYELGAENIAASLSSLGSDGAYNEGVSYAEMSVGRLHEAVKLMRLAGDLRCSDSSFARNNWRWFVQMHMPGHMLVNSYDSGRSALPVGFVNIPMASLGAAAMATTDPDAIPTMRYLYPAMKGNYSLEAIEFAAALEVTPGPSELRLDPFAYFPSQQQVVWRSQLQAQSAPQTALGLWMRGGSTTDNHCQRDQGQVSIYCGNRQILIDCGVSDYGVPEYENFYSAAAGHSTMQFGGLTPNGKPVYAPVTVRTLNNQGGSVSIDCTAGFPSTSNYSRDVDWSTGGDVKITDRATFRTPAPATTELFRFHTGTDAELTIQGAGHDWTVSWPGVVVRLTADVAIDVNQASFPDQITVSKVHRAIVVRCASACSEINLVTAFQVDTSLHR